MNLRKMKTEELALLLNGLRATHVADQVALKDRLEKKLEGLLAERGVKLAA